MQKEKVRIFALARELDMESKDLVALCRQHGIDVKNQLSTLEPETRDQIVQIVKRGAPVSAPPQSETESWRAQCLWCLSSRRHAFSHIS